MGEREKVFQMCRDVLHSVSAGKFELLADWETGLLRSAGTLQAELEIKRPADVDAARGLIRNILGAGGWDRQRILHIMLAVSEGVTNVLKHAHSGKMEIRETGNGMRVIVADQGPGLNLLMLPHMIVRQGYSTKSSLGYGFNIMYRVSDKIHLASSEQGTFLALDFLNRAL
ncbi:hypothetical protein JCM15765_28580 [Paradesulfitobacterium aromaticivorans]